MTFSVGEKALRAIRWSERYTKIDMVYLAKGGVSLCISQAVYAICVLLLAIAFARLIPQETYGMYKYITATSGILLSLGMTGLITPLTRSIARGNGGEYTYALRIRIRWGLLGFAGSLLLALYYLWSGNMTLAFSFALIAPFIPFVESLTLYHSILHGKKKFGTAALYASMSQVLATAALLVTLLVTDNLFIILLAYFAPWVFLRLWFQHRTLSFFPLTGPWDKDTIPAGKHLSIMNVFPLIAQQLDKILLFQYLGAAELAVYAFAVAIPDQIKSLVKNLQVLILPKFSGQEIRDIQGGIKSKMLRLTGALTLAALVYWVAAPLIYRAMFPTYISSILYSQIYGLSIVATALILPSSMLQAGLATKELYRCDIIRSFAQILLLFAGVLYFGVMGVILARVAAESFGYALFSFFAWRYAAKAS